MKQIFIDTLRGAIAPEAVSEQPPGQGVLESHQPRRIHRERTSGEPSAHMAAAAAAVPGTLLGRSAMAAASVMTI